MTLFRSWWRIVKAIWRLIKPCKHPAIVRERRDVLGVSLPHYVCLKCGHAELIIKRDGDLVTFTEPAHERMRAFPKSQPKSPADVVRMRRPTR